ncbi:ZYRO0B16698p [Zygosaccharomyces rouxii]|uniref:ZYRO0B16698p n=1 Tax=Zygosaccharomyces rouxii (strain ATCC 2623 / CBS 732 / NBRC 1130 / NCYC 568 / NRRL Y-229) TaxID=559307 RepID=C5DSG6_ZYGRC|nr:uncharacterized protein ZYRO0B16698g [Zygosaccharomyces rouxii]KAH9199743.1 hypothetical protein LQ764DRAFT_104758 [Zygosaccharomyces rouxii]CAR26727.1 ZYRO0B16698p [Zygosaccharomyces rouxii]
MPDPSPSLSTSTVSDSNSASSHQEKRYNHHHSLKHRGSKNHTGKRQNKKGASNNEQTHDKKKEAQDEKSGTDKNAPSRRKKNQNSNNERKPKNKDNEHHNNGGKRRPTSKNKNDKKEGKDFKLSIDTSKKELSIRRENEIAQCIHVLSDRNFRLFKRGQYVTSYGFTRNQKLLGVPNCKFIINVPLDYPKSPIKLQYGKSNAQQQPGNLEEKLDRLTKNFNYKSSQLLSLGEPIISQLNYLVERAEYLSQPGYKLIDKREKSFHSKFV